MRRGGASVTLAAGASPVTKKTSATREKKRERETQRRERNFSPDTSPSFSFAGLFFLGVGVWVGVVS